MKITVNTKEIQAAFKNLLKVSPTKCSIAILNDNIKLTAYDDKVELTATDIETYVSISLKDIEILETGSIVITKDTLKLVSKLTDDYMTITYNTIESGKRNVKYTGIVPDHYPNHPTYNFNNHAFTLSKDKMFEIIGITYACCERGSSQPVLEGLHFNNNTVTACDRHRLAKVTIDNNNLTHDMIIPAYVINYIKALTDKQYKGEYVFTLDATSRYVQITFDNVTMVIALIEGTYPNTTKIIPQSFITEVKVNKVELIEELKVLREVFTDKIKLVTMEVLAGKFTLYAESEANGNKLTSEIQSTITGDNIAVGANADYILEALNTNNSEYVTLKYTGQTTPFMIDSNVLILPYRINRASQAA